MQIGALWTILYASLIDFLCFFKPFLKRGDFSAVAERVSAPFAAYLHFVTTPSLHGELSPPRLLGGQNFTPWHGCDIAAVWYARAIQTAFPHTCAIGATCETKITAGKGGSCATSASTQPGNTAAGVMLVLLRNICHLGADMF